jgi:NAD(P)-dependent dehydrogenase (short-subunit alcohol dehydrogenase family)
MACLEGRSIAVTGAARGLGQAYVRAIVAEGAAALAGEWQDELLPLGLAQLEIERRRELG